MKFPLPATVRSRTAGLRPGAFFRDYEAALQESDADIVYLSLPNAMHEHWVMAALGAGKHVIVDKPAMMTAGRQPARRERGATHRPYARRGDGVRLSPPVRGAVGFSQPARPNYLCRCPVHHSTASDFQFSQSSRPRRWLPWDWAPMLPVPCGCSAAAAGANDGVGRRQASRDRESTWDFGVQARLANGGIFPAILVSRANIRTGCWLWRVQAP